MPLAGFSGPPAEPEKTSVAHSDEGFDFLGFRIQRHRQKGSTRYLICTYPSKRSRAIRRKVSEATGWQTTHFDAGKLFLRPGQITRGWALYSGTDRHPAPSACSSTTCGGGPGGGCGRITRNRNATWIIRHYYGPGQWWPRSNGIAFFQPATVKIKRYRYRGTKIGNPWSARPAAP